jgi:hypothetical protein
MTFRLHWAPASPQISARACGCTFCLKHGGVWTSHPTASLEVLIQDASLAGKYSFATKTAEFHICSRCGVVPLVTSRMEGRVYAVVNINTFDEIDRSMLRASPATFEGEDESARLERRRQNWIPDVKFIEV